MLLKGRALEDAAVAWVMQYEMAQGRTPVDTRRTKGAPADIASSGRLIEVKSTATSFRGWYLSLQPGQLKLARSDASFHVYVVEGIGSGDDPGAITLRILTGAALRSMVAKARAVVSYEVPWPTALYDASPVEPAPGTTGHPDKFAWSEGDVEVHPGPCWSLTYEAGEATVLVQDADGLLSHLRQHGMTGDDRTIVGLFLRSPRAELLPRAIEVELIERGLAGD